ncbi:MAG: hypothetical protein ACLGHP_08870, partial [Vicinamibacteria bacterium]
GDPAMAAHAVTHVRIDVPPARGGALERDVDAWIFTGRPTARRRDVADLDLVRRLAAWVAPVAHASALQFGDWGRRSEQVQESNDRIETYEEWYARQERIKRGERPEEDVFDSGHVSDLIESIFGGTDDRLEQIGETHGRLAEWLAHATDVIGSLGDDTPVDPTDAPFAPGRAGGQTLVGSGATW